MMRVIVYHHNCHDGLTALWVCLQVWPDAVPYEGRYTDPPDLERLRGHDVVVVDFSWKRPAMMRVAEVAKSLMVLDHHQTAQAELEGLDFAMFDPERSGAGLAWDMLHGGDRPPLVDHVEDRDLWRFRLPGTRAIHAACNSYPLTIEARHALMRCDVDQLALEGRGILRYHDQLVSAAAQNAVRQVIGGHEVPAVACPARALVDDLGHALAQGAPFGACWLDKPDGTRIYSLRSTPDGLDVAQVAQRYGGGGHRNAAGFSVSPDLGGETLMQRIYAEGDAP